MIFKAFWLSWRWEKQFSFPSTGMSLSKVSDCDVKNKTVERN